MEKLAASPSPVAAPLAAANCRRRRRACMPLPPTGVTAASTPPTPTPPPSPPPSPKPGSPSFSPASRRRHRRRGASIAF
eukprot:scaffold81239_cov54-Phaeocystis_antarctica.AAC.1